MVVGVLDKVHDPSSAFSANKDKSSAGQLLPLVVRLCKVAKYFFFVFVLAADCDVYTTGEPQAAY